MFLNGLPVSPAAVRASRRVSFHGPFPVRPTSPSTRRRLSSFHRQSFSSPPPSPPCPRAAPPRLSPAPRHASSPASGRLSSRSFLASWNDPSPACFPCFAALLGPSSACPASPAFSSDPSPPCLASLSDPSLPLHPSPASWSDPFSARPRRRMDRGKSVCSQSGWADSATMLLPAMTDRSGRPRNDWAAAAP